VESELDVKTQQFDHLQDVVVKSMQLDLDQTKHSFKEASQQNSQLAQTISEHKQSYLQLQS